LLSVRAIPAGRPAESGGNAPIDLTPSLMPHRPDHGASRIWHLSLRLAAGLFVISPLVAGAATGVTLCPTAGLFGIPCPGCGLGRATLAALSGHFAEAMRYHPLFFVVSPIYLFLLLSLGWQFVTGNAPRWPRLPERLLLVATVGLGVALVAVWALRLLGALGGPVPVHPWFRPVS
jgi:hypothetical protein